MAWKEFTDELSGPVETKRTCWLCKLPIIAGRVFITRRGLHVDKAGAADADPRTVTLHEECCDPPSHLPADPVDPPTEATNEPAAADVPASATVSDPAAPGPTAEQREKLAHYAEIKIRNDEVLAKFFEWDAAHAQAATLKKELDSMRKELNQFIRRGKDPQRPLAFPDDDSDSRPASSSPGVAAEPEWKGRALDVLGLPASLLARLAEGAIETLGHLKAFWDAGRVLTELKGIGAEKAAAVADAWAEYAKAHQEVYGMDDQASGDAHDDDPFAGDEPAATNVADDAGEVAVEDDDPFANDADPATAAAD